MPENVLEKIIKKKIEKIENSKKSISINLLNELIKKNKTFNLVALTERTKINKINRNRKSGDIAFFSISKRTDEIANIRDDDKNAKIKCLMKKK